MRECSSGNTVQFLIEIDRNPESQFSKSLKNVFDKYLAYCLSTKKKLHVILSMQYIYSIFGYCVDISQISCTGDDFSSCILQSLRKDLINIPYQCANIQRFFRIFGKYLYWYGNFCHFTAPFDDFPDYSGFSFRIRQIIDVFGTCSEP